MSRKYYLKGKLESKVIHNFKSPAKKLTAEQYLDLVMKGKLKDPVITFLLRCGRTPVKVVPNYLEDEESHNYGTLME